jgi:3'-phosphoadenosine 5'-phosphosulfate sulfotransferase (PAPS reductase)/FAD synthetase
LVTPLYGVAVTAEISAALRQGAPVAVGVSGGKDSQAAAIRVSEYLNEIRHSGPRVLIHADLGRIEWSQSRGVCDRLAQRLGWELIVVRRTAGDLLQRWETRWENNVQRYAELSCVRLILPWSTPGMRFCTSELKTAVICSALRKRFPSQTIISAVGIRRAESSNRARMPIASVQPGLSRKAVTGWNWNPIIEWPTATVYSYLEERKEPLHAAYSDFGASRVSCSACIMSSLADLQAALRYEQNHAAFRTIVDLEIRSTFAFQGSRWLGDVANEILSPETHIDLANAKERAEARQRVEAHIPDNLLFVSGWPQTVPSVAEAESLATVRQQVAAIVGLNIEYTDAAVIRDRFATLIAEQEQRGVANAASPGPAAQQSLFA